ncbi:transcriptional repressor [Irregularibacter muris]|uniref:Transcriptional repressor n=1 Tax=Irregularibacter muris TaxID=1796619 RepID=A0AAE3HDD3_9FIRM|nr:Fur family transcriptional regulator [Irregularibacter muris]MCR1897956.1 transcriptional repressor [Irregularibacter muris]
MFEYNDIKEELRKKGYKLTPQRRNTLNVILERDGEHLSTEEIYEYVKKECPEIGLATVYRTLQLFEDIGLLHKHNFDDGCNRYELADPKQDHQHHHLICLSCGKVSEVEGDLLEELEQEIQTKKGFQITNHTLKFFGYCKDCKKKQ